MSDPPMQEAVVRTRSRRHFHLVWLIPIVAALVGGWLAWQAISSRGEEIVLVFNSGDGIAAGQTRVRHKAVELGVVRSVTLAPDLRSVEVGVEMQRQADRFLTQSARFWVVRPRLSASTISGLDTLVSGSYIELDPGQPDQPRQLHFQGLEEPPAVRSDEPGTTFTLRTDRIGGLSTGAPVFYRDVPAGELLGFDPVRPGQPVVAHAFIRHPFDAYVRAQTHFWNASGLSVGLGASGLQVKVESLQAVIAGGVAFDTPAAALQSGDRPAPSHAFPLYPDEAAATAAGYSKRIKFVSYFEGSVRGLTVGSNVEFFGIQVGTVTGVRLDFSPDFDRTRVAVAMEVQPERFMRREDIHDEQTLAISRRLVARGLRAQLRNANLLTGSMLVEFVFAPGSPGIEPVETPEGVVLPGTSGGLDSLTASLSQVANKLDELPLGQIGQHLDDALHGAGNLLNGPEIRRTLAAVAAAAQRLPEVTASLTATAERAGKLAGSVQNGYGADSPFARDLQRVLAQLSDTARSVRLLADYLDQHPEALLRGRTGQASER